MFTLEDKVNLALAYIACDDKVMRAQAKAMIIKALKEIDFSPEIEVEAPKDISNDISEVIDEVLKDIGIPCRLSGYDALHHAIRIVLANPEKKYNITNDLYVDVAACVGSTNKRVERVIRHAIEVAFERNDIDNMHKIFGNTISLTKGNLTNQEMIVHCVKEVRRRLKKRGMEV